MDTELGINWWNTPRVFYDCKTYTHEWDLLGVYCGSLVSDSIQFLVKIRGKV